MFWVVFSIGVTLPALVFGITAPLRERSCANSKHDGDRLDDGATRGEPILFGGGHERPPPTVSSYPVFGYNMTSKPFTSRSLSGLEWKGSAKLFRGVGSSDQ